MGRSSTAAMNASEAAGADSRYASQLRGLGESMTSSPSLRMNTSSVENWYSFGNRTAWLRLVMKTLAVRGMASNPPHPLCHIPYVYGGRVLNTCLYGAFRAVLADLEERRFR